MSEREKTVSLSLSLSQSGEQQVQTMSQETDSAKKTVSKNYRSPAHRGSELPGPGSVHTGGVVGTVDVPRERRVVSDPFSPSEHPMLRNPMF